MKTKRIVSTLLVVCLLLAPLPTAALALDAHTARTANSLPTPYFLLNLRLFPQISVAPS